MSLLHTSIPSPAITVPKPRLWAGVTVTGLAAAMILAAHWLPSGLISWETIRILASAAIGCLALYAALILSKAQADDTRRTTFKVALGLWWFLLISPAILFRGAFDLAHIEEMFEGRFELPAYADGISWIVALLVVMLISRGIPGYFAGLFSGQSKWLSVFGVVCLLSSFYSPRPIYSLAWAGKLWLVILLLHCCSACMRDVGDLRAFFTVTFFAFAVLTVFPAARALADPDLAFWEGRLGAAGVHPVSISEAAGSFLLLSLTLYQLRKQKWIIPFGFLAAVIMVRSGGKAAILAGVVCATFFFVIQKKFGPALGVFAGLFLILLATLASAPLFAYFQDYQQSESVWSLTGRTTAWTSAWPAIMQSPLWGHGYLASRFVYLQLGEFEGALGIHNSFLEVAYDNGVIGLILLVAIFFFVWKNGRRVMKQIPGSEAYLFAVGLLTMYLNTLLTSISESNIGGQTNSSFALFLVLVVMSQALVRLSTGSRARILTSS